MRNPLKELQKANSAVEHSIDRLDFEGRALVSRDVVGNLRHLVEHVAMYASYGDVSLEGNYFALCKAVIQEMKKKKETRFIAEFHGYLQKAVSHYVPSEDSAERLLLKYYENLLHLKRYAADKHGIAILSNLNKIPLDTDPGLKNYHESIARSIDVFMSANAVEIERDRFYVRSARPFFVNDSVYYETTLVPAFDSSSKCDRILVFSAFKIPTNNAVSVSAKRTSIDGLGFSLPVTIVDAYRISVRPCELNGLLKILGKSDIARLNGNYSSYISLMEFLTRSGMNLCDIALLPDDDFASIMSEITYSGSECPVHLLLSEAHSFLSSGLCGVNVLKYLLAKPRNRVIKNQLASSPNGLLGNLCLKSGCAPFDRQPYCTDLIRHVVAVDDLYQYIDPDLYEDNFLANKVSLITNNTRSLYVKDSEFDTHLNIDELITKHNNTLYGGHRYRDLVHEDGCLFVRGVEEDIVDIINGLLSLSNSGLSGYAAACESWLEYPRCKIDDLEKSAALKTMFDETHVAFIYGSAGTGKTTMVNIVCSFLHKLSKVAIANTNPAVDSLRRKIVDSNCDFMTVTKYLNRQPECDVLIVDECSAVCNSDMKKIIEFGGFELLMLVGDVRQIESIKFGNWFSLAQDFLPDKCIHEFDKPWRAKNGDLLRLWSAVRKMSPDITEILAACDFTSNLDESVVNRTDEDEIVLCLNYDGLYGINNMNKMLQSENKNEAVSWNFHTYKVGDPVLFNESDRFYPLLYNNLKGRLVEIKANSRDEMMFTVAVPIDATKYSAWRYDGLELLSSHGGETFLRFSVKKAKDRDGEDIGEDGIVPFQVAYAVSVHKAQGLEYSSVKLIITKDVEERITHSVFYTAITRARERLHIYWSPESQNKILSSFAISNNNKDAYLLSSRRGLELHPK